MAAGEASARGNRQIDFADVFAALVSFANPPGWWPGNGTAPLTYAEFRKLGRAQLPDPAPEPAPVAEVSCEVRGPHADWLAARLNRAS
ncbi:hypothetical protein [Nocardia panacis]|uniref:hypothetical protein n=1 Tax=Nocardia panacis TaxID=2340916 RepID=UPI0011C49732|nr:hypothetical protein [Nocardia panacis]